jgi:hypothetical protein
MARTAHRFGRMALRRPESVDHELMRTHCWRRRHAYVTRLRSNTAGSQKVLETSSGMRSRFFSFAGARATAANASICVRAYCSMNSRALVRARGTAACESGRDWMEWNQAQKAGCFQKAAATFPATLFSH